jgi:hypothetical protein
MSLTEDHQTHFNQDLAICGDGFTVECEVVWWHNLMYLILISPQTSECTSGWTFYKNTRHFKIIDNLALLKLWNKKNCKNVSTFENKILKNLRKYRHSLILNNFKFKISIFFNPEYCKFSVNIRRKSATKLSVIIKIFSIRGLSKKYPTLFFPGKPSDGRLANLITVVGGGTFMRMRDLLWPCLVRLSILGS